MFYFPKFLDALKEGRFIDPEICDKVLANAIENTIPFVFMPQDGDTESVKFDDSVPLDLPFKSCFFEIGPDQNGIFSDISQIKSEGKLFKICGLYINEIRPKEYELGFLVWYISDVTKQQCFTISLKMPDATKTHMLAMIQALLKRMYSEEVGESYF